MNNELQTKLSWLDFSDMGEDATYLRDKAVEYASVELKSRFEKGRILEEIAQKYANQKVGCYCKFCEKLKIPTSTADRYRKIYNYIFPNWENINDAPDLLNGQFEALASGKANPQLAKAVETGEITNSKEYKAMEARLKESEAKAEQAERDRDNAQERTNQVMADNDRLIQKVNAQAEELQGMKDNPQVVIKDSEQTTNELWNLRGENKQLQDKITELENSVYDSSSKDYAIENLKKEIRKLEQKLKEQVAHSQGLTLREYVTEKDERVKQFEHLLKTKDEEQAAAKVLQDFVWSAMCLPDSPIEMRESLRCWANDELDKDKAIEDMRRTVKIAEERLEILIETLEGNAGKPRLEVVKK